MAQRFVAAQTDFGGGQVDEDANRREDAKVPKTGARLMSNWRQRNTGTLDVRPGRSAICFVGPRAERFRMSAQQELIISFSTNTVTIMDIAGNVIATQTDAVNFIWTNATVAKINWCTTPDRIVICYPGMRPVIIKWDGATGFTFLLFGFLTLGSEINEPFYRPSPSRGILIRYDAYSGVTTLTASAPYFTNAMVGIEFSLGGRQVTILSVGSVTPVTTCTATVVGSLLPRMKATVDALNQSDATFLFPPNTIAETSIQHLLIEVGIVYYTGGPDFTQWAVDFFLLSGGVGGNVSQFEQIVGVSGGMQICQAGSAATSKGSFDYTTDLFSMLTWTQGFMNSETGWPAACFFAHQRLGFCDFPQRPDAILWSATGIYDVFWVDSAAALTNPTAGTNADSAMLQFLSGQPHVRNVVEWNGDEFIFTDRGIYYVPLSTGGQPLTPGTIRFASISDATASSIKPTVTRDALIFTSASNDRVSAIIRTGNFTTPYAEADLTTYHSQLINSPIATAVGRGDEGFPERYIYVLNADGSVVVGRTQDDKSFVGWLPWTGAGKVSWLSQGLLDILFVTVYGAKFVAEDQNALYFLDHAVKINAPPANMLSGGNGAFVAFANGTVRVMDGAIDYGVRNVDATGHLIKNPEDDFSSPTIVAGQPFASVYSPFTPEAPLGQDQKQRQRLRRITRAVASVYNSSGFTFGGRTIPPFDFGDNPLAQPILKETTYRTRPLGRAFDPSITLVKDTPGPLTLVEFALELTV
jgi:hypothetical protein